MDMIIYQDDVEYDLWLKLILGISVALLLVPGILFYIDGYVRDVSPSLPDAESRLGAILLFAGTALMAALFWAIMPQRLYILEDRIRVKLGAFSYSITFDTIKSVEAAKGLTTVEEIIRVTETDE